jgi:serine/threonine-protein kinase
MASQQEGLPSTVLFCRSNDDGSVTPNWDESCEAALQGQFEVGLTIAGRFLLTKKLGHGSMGRVFLARDLRLDRAVAVKVVLHRLRGSSDLEAMLQREAKLGANLNHQCIAAVYDFGVHDNKSYTIFEYVEGQTLRDLLQTRSCLLLD